MTEDEYLHLRERWLLLAEAAPDEHVRASLLRAARNYEIEARLIKHAAPRIAESRAAIAKADALLGGRYRVDEPKPPAPKVGATLTSSIKLWSKLPRRSVEVKSKAKSGN